ncbi:hypothetical protein acsn021_37310 [Anaerocolumna cellulosilytica]|uniref:Uncharacterized protein n=1 Tax=Anaerocolumna cellulosilytica TaxID=433286 RepID=A0A6S6RA64_9FIRM|nr:DUF5717 family protein [Anaerocolumna cellulosilytica]MBB5195001.1 hypothetical protein [Anaerocolumna cellulosilytica]BCJ96162.1 hypothetical protein acsn021_37310 [Anaerocolumna cellulosilytica]
MKEKVERLAKCVFEYEKPDILLSEEEIVISVDAGRTYSGNFTIKNTRNTSFKGILYSSHPLFYLKQDSFIGAENQITYEVLGDYEKPGEIIKGHICIVSECGELQLPFTITIEAPYLNSSLGKVKDLYNFTNLAKSDWAEAIKLLKTREFSQVVTYHDAKYQLLHQGLIRSRSASQALEEFLVTIRKKLHVNFIVDKNVLNYNIGSDNIMDKVTLMKDNWGYAEIRVTTDVPFITLDHKIIWSDYFVGNTYPLEFVLNPAYMRPGINYGRIYLTTVHDTMIVEITCKCKKGKKEKSEDYKKYREYAYLVIDNYLNFRLNKLSLEEYVTQTAPVLQDLMTVGDKDFYHLIYVHLLIVSGKETEAGNQLEDLQAKADVWKFTASIKYCGYLYLKAMHTKEDSAIEEALQATRESYEQTSDWRLLWLLFYIDKRYDHNKALKLAEIKQQFERGCKSPILYYEAITAISEEPVLLHELSAFEIQILNWGTKNNCITEETAILFTYMAGRRKKYHDLIYNCLIRLYKDYQMKDLLSAICSLLIKGHKRNIRYFKWFRLGVEEQLRITELYEYYMYTLDETGEVELPQPILLYFIYNSNLSDRKKAFLYAYIIKNKEKLPAIYHNYYMRMEQFAYRLLKEHVINPNLALLYEEIITRQGMTAEVALELPYVLFRYEIGCNNPLIKGVCVVHKEIEEEVYIPLINGCAQVDIYTGSAEILLIDTMDNRYSTTVDYTLNKLMPWDYYSESCFVHGAVHPMLLLNLSERAGVYQKFDDQSVEIRKLLLQVKGLTGAYYSKILFDLIAYYYDNFQGEQVETYLQKIDLKELKKDDRNKLLEILIIRDNYETAKKAAWEFGYDGVASKRLIKLCSYLLQETQDEEEEKRLAKLAFYIFKEGKYNEEILLYLVEHYNGTTEDMYSLWEAANGFELDTALLEERLLGQILFAESYLEKGIDVFLRYYRRGTNHKLIRGFLSYYAYKYVIMDRALKLELFEIMKKELVYEDNDVCMLALLKKFSTQEQFTNNDMEFIDYNLHQFVEKGIVLPFFKRFQDVLSLSPGINDRFYIEYISNPANKVTIHYSLQDKKGTGECIAEEMMNVYLGIHVKEFILFCDESIQYYISEEDSEGQIVNTESVTVRLGQDMKLEEDTRYNQLNFMLTALEMQDDKTLSECINNYYMQQSVIKDLFKPL